MVHGVQHYFPKRKQLHFLLGRVRVYVSEDLRLTGIKNIAQTHQHTQKRGRAELGSNPNAMRHHVAVVTRRAPRYVVVAAGVAACEAISYESVRWDRSLRCMQIFVVHLFLR